jgi:uncharacterized membrane protein
LLAGEVYNFPGWYSVINMVFTNAMKSMKNQRKLFPDVLKGIAVLMMIQVHVMGLFASHEVFSGVFGRWSLFFGGEPAAPVFMTIMGYFIGNRQANLKKSLLRGLQLVGLGLLLNVGLNAHLFIRIFKGQILLSPWTYLFGVDI